MRVLFANVRTFGFRVTRTFLHALDSTKFSMDFLVGIVGLANTMLDLSHRWTLGERWTFTLNVAGYGAKVAVDILGFVNSLA